MSSLSEFSSPEAISLPLSGDKNHA
jgi:hypothetical protein